jgi:hypothetical protein
VWNASGIAEKVRYAGGEQRTNSIAAVYAVSTPQSRTSDGFVS